MVKDKFHIENGNDLSDLIFPQYTYIEKYIHIYIYIYIEMSVLYICETPCALYLFKKS